jgi:LPS O-antigen subunit length determinant protein (WzzB/FepE family)
MPKKIKPQKKTAIRKGYDLCQTFVTIFRENRNIVYIAIIGFCLSITVLYTLGRYWGWWTA